MSSLQTEYTIIGAMVENELARHDALAGLTAGDFSLDSCQRTFRAIAGMVETGVAVDFMTVCAALSRKGELDAVGGGGWLAECIDGVPRNCAIGEHIKSLLDASLGRKGYNLCQTAQQRLQDPSEAPQEVLDELVRDITTERPQDSMTAAQVMAYALDVETSQVIPTGIRELDEMLGGGIRTKQMTIIGAKPSAGKSALCRQIERSAVQHGFGIHAHSIEVPKETWILHHACALSGVNHWKMRERDKLDPNDWSYLRGWANKIAEWNYVIDDAGSVNIDTLIAKSRLSVMRRGIKLVTVDYMQLISADRKLSRHLQMSEIANRLKEFAKTYDVAVLALSQISRSGDPNNRPTVESLKESGDIEAAANVVLLNYRPKADDKYTGEDEIIVGKNRDGPVGQCELHFDWRTLAFRGRTGGEY